jgi:hypothetical protein
MKDMTQVLDIRATKLFGFFTALFSTVFYIIFDVAAVLGLTGVIKSEFWISISWYGPSLLLAYSFLGMSLSVFRDEIIKNKTFSAFAVMLAIIYATLNSVVYVIQVMIIAPSFINNTFQNVSLFEMAAGKPFYAVNGLAYSLMGFSTLFMGLSIKGTGLVKKIKIMMLIHGFAAPFVFGALVIKPLFFISSTVGITYPIIGIIVSIYMWQTRNTEK